MQFWLDKSGQPSAYPHDRHLEPVASKIWFEEAKPPTILRARPSRARKQRMTERAAAIAVALTLHVGLTFLLLWSSSKTMLNVAPQADTAAMFASLTPASSITPTPSAQPPLPVDVLVTQSDAGNLPAQTFAASSDEQPKANLDPPLAQSAQVDQTTLNTSRTGTSNPGPVHDDNANPWIHASVAVPDLSINEKLWMAVRPCWQGSELKPSSIRLVLDDGGSVQSMTDLEGGEAQANPKVQALAQAVLACAPYDRLVSKAGSYLIVAPG